MSILIKGVNLPRSGVRYLLAVDSDGKVYNWRSEESPSCKAFNVPSHGRLIDADALMVRVERETPLSDVYEKTMRRYLNTAPTIIEAEEGET